MNRLLPIKDPLKVGKAHMWLSLLLEPAVKQVVLHLTVPKYFEENPLNLEINHWIIEIVKFVRQLNKELANQNYVASDIMTTADIGIFWQVELIRLLTSDPSDPWIERFTNVTDWLTKLKKDTQI